MIFDVRVAIGGGLVLMGTAMALDANAQSGPVPVNWTYGSPGELSPASDISMDFGRSALEMDTQSMDLALFASTDGLVAAQQRGVWRRQTDGSIEQIRIRQYSPPTMLPQGSIERARFEASHRDVAYIRAWPLVSGGAGAVQFEVTPHAGVGINGQGGTAEAGATIRVGQLEVADGDNAYQEDEGRWYLFAAGTGTAVGLNWARGMNGWDRRLSHDEGAFIGDAQIGVAWRRGDTQTSFGYVHREVTADGVHGGSGIDRDATEGFVALQFSIRPSW